MAECFLWRWCVSSWRSRSRTCRCIRGWSSRSHPFQARPFVGEPSGNTCLMTDCDGLSSERHTNEKYMNMMPMHERSARWSTVNRRQQDWCRITSIGCNWKPVRITVTLIAGHLAWNQEEHAKLGGTEQIKMSDWTILNTQDLSGHFTSPWRYYWDTCTHPWPGKVQNGSECTMQPTWSKMELNLTKMQPIFLIWGIFNDRKFLVEGWSIYTMMLEATEDGRISDRK
jgi:hypothetical protein